MVTRLIIPIIALGIVIGQQDINLDEDPRYLQAKSMEKGGLYNQAEDIYILLYEEQPKSTVYFLALKSMLKNRGDYEALLSYSLAYSKERDADLFSQLEVLESFILLNQESEWKNLLSAVVDSNINAQGSVILIVNRLISLQKINEAKDIILKYREVSGDIYFYSLQLSNFLNMSMLYKESSNELLLYLRENPTKINFISNRFMSFPNDSKTNIEVEDVLLRSKVSGSSKILSDLYLRQKRYDESYSILRELDSPEYIFDFIKDIVIVKEYSLAITVLKDLIARTNDQTIKKKAIFEISKIIEIQSLRTTVNELNIANFYFKSPIFNSDFINLDEDRSQDLEYSISIYDSLGINNNNIDAMLRLADLRYLVLGDLDGAMNTYNEILEKSRRRSQLFRASSRVIDINISKGDLEGARASINNAKAVDMSNDQRIELGLKEIQIYFYSYLYTEAKKLAKDLLTKTEMNHYLYNDILSFLHISLVFEGHNDAINLFSEAQFKLKQNKRTESIRILEQLSDYSDETIAALVKYQLSFLWYLHGDYAKSLVIAAQLDGDDIYSELALILMAEINEIALEDVVSAIEIYLKFINKFPRSIFYDEVRIHLRELAS